MVLVAPGYKSQEVQVVQQACLVCCLNHSSEQCMQNRKQNKTMAKNMHTAHVGFSRTYSYWPIQDLKLGPPLLHARQMFSKLRYRT